MNEWRATIAKENDGIYPAEPGQRCSQIVLEAWLKKKCLAQPSINSKFGWKYISHTETASGVESTFIDCHNQQKVVRSRYLVGADGGSSRVRKNSGIKMLGGPLPISLFLVHFRSQELAQNLPFGKFWHMCPPFGGFIINQDEERTFTAHMELESLDQDVSKIDPYEWVYKCFGGAGEPYRFKIDKILVSSAWRPNFNIAEPYSLPGARVLLAGDACTLNSQI
jgi:2-polyprenyl-6-methoxyphenol hydroxylase-like FAD-dependent oxidoreductase